MNYGAIFHHVAIISAHQIKCKATKFSISFQYLMERIVNEMTMFSMGLHGFPPQFYPIQTNSRVFACVIVPDILDWKLLWGSRRHTVQHMPLIL